MTNTPEISPERPAESSEADEVIVETREQLLNQAVEQFPKDQESLACFTE